MRPRIAAALFCFLAAGCTSPADVISSHFLALTDIAVAHRNDCDAMGSALSAYLAENGASLRGAVRDVGNASADDAMLIFKSSVELHQATRSCETENVRTFLREMSETVLLDDEAAMNDEQ